MMIYLIESEFFIRIRIELNSLFSNNPASYVTDCKLVLQKD